MFDIEIQNENAYPVDETRLIEAAFNVLTTHNAAPNSAVTIVITDDLQVETLNRQFRDVDAPTDVLSFPAEKLPEELAQELGEPPYLGDLVIAFPYASAQAKREKHDLMDSLALLVVHGTLHLLGYDHETPEDKAEMWRVQAESLTALSIPLNIVPALEAAPHDDEEDNRGSDGHPSEDDQKQRS